MITSSTSVANLANGDPNAVISALIGYWPLLHHFMADACMKQVARNLTDVSDGFLLNSQYLTVVFDRLYTLRNQLIHGNAIWNSSVNRDQIRDGVKIMDHLVPTIIYLMMAHPNQLWGDALYPVVDLH